MNFKDHFSERAVFYAAYRPLYPDALFDFVAGLTPDHELALDCATGNGQAAIGLAARFERVIAIDASAAQISNATPHARIDYEVSAAESTGLPGRSVNLVTAAQALHWLDSTKFFAEVRRVLVSRGAVAIWGYGDPVLDNLTLRETLDAFNRGVLHVQGGQCGHAVADATDGALDGGVDAGRAVVGTPAGQAEPPQTRLGRRRPGRVVARVEALENRRRRQNTSSTMARIR